MTSILYYSNNCEHSKKILQILSKTQANKNIHFMCIDNRVKEAGNIYIILANGQKIIMPPEITKVPALLLINNKQVVYGDDQILSFLKPVQEVITKQATNNYMEPMAYSLGGNGSSFGIMSDNYSFLDTSADDMKAIGNGGTRQMHNYVPLSDNYIIEPPEAPEQSEYNKQRSAGNITLEQLQAQRDKDIVIPQKRM